MRAARRGAAAARPGAGGSRDRAYRRPAALLRPGDSLVFNDTKVIPARLVGRRGAATVEMTLHRDLGGGALARLRQGRAAAAAPATVIDFADGFRRRPSRQRQPEGDVTLRFDRDGAAFRAALARHGAMPLPPYIKRAARRRPARPRATTRRSSPAPRARSPRRPPGCISPRRCSSARRAPASTARRVTLHVGAGTFLPVKADDPREHQMHAEWGIYRRRDRRAHRRGAARAAAASSRSARPACACSKAPPAETGEVAALRRRDPALHHARLPLPRGRPAADQFPPAALDPVHAGRRLRRARPHQSRLCPRHRRSAIASSPTATPA